MRVVSLVALTALVAACSGAASLTEEEGPRDAGLPDLTLDQVTVTAGSLVAGESAEIDAVVLNQGATTAPPCVLAVDQDGSPLLSVNVPQLDPGARWTLPAGHSFVLTHSSTISFEIDAEEGVVESDETNNTATWELEVMSGCTPTTCTAEGKNCGAIPDGCGGTIPCGTCGNDETCGGGGTANVCGPGTCSTTTCAAEGKNCGVISDGCEGTLSCGACDAPETCGGGGVENVCGCVPTSCVAQGKNCGSIPDGCGVSLNCGMCTSPETCGGGGAQNVCGSVDCSATGITDRALLVCQRWTCDRAELAEGTWSGAVAGCNAGDISSEGRANALKLLNLYRFLAELPPVTTDATRNQKAQECALMMDANNALSHSPPTSWACYTAGGAEAAGKSNISTGRGVSSVDRYMIDSGNATTIGHRRWILSNSLGPVGLGSTSGSSCMWVLSGSGTANRTWTAWPPPGPVPFQAFKPIVSAASIDSTGWTIQSQSIDLSSAQVTVTEGGVDRPVTTTVLLNNYGSTYAVRFNPQGWSTEAGKHYVVTVSGVTTPISYTVEPIACP